MLYCSGRSEGEEYVRETLKNRRDFARLSGRFLTEEIDSAVQSSADAVRINEAYRDANPSDVREAKAIKVEGHRRGSLMLGKVVAFSKGPRRFNPWGVVATIEGHGAIGIVIPKVGVVYPDGTWGTGFDHEWDVSVTGFLSFVLKEDGEPAVAADSGDPATCIVLTTAGESGIEMSRSKLSRFGVKAGYFLDEDLTKDDGWR